MKGTIKFILTCLLLPTLFLSNAVYAGGIFVKLDFYNYSSQNQPVVVGDSNCMNTLEMQRMGPVPPWKKIREVDRVLVYVNKGDGCKDATNWFSKSGTQRYVEFKYAGVKFTLDDSQGATPPGASVKPDSGITKKGHPIKVTGSGVNTFTIQLGKPPK